MEELESMAVRKTKKMGRIPEMRVEERMELDLLRRANHDHISLVDYVRRVLGHHLYGVVRTESMDEEAER